METTITKGLSKTAVEKLANKIEEEYSDTPKLGFLQMGRNVGKTNLYAQIISRAVDYITTTEEERWIQELSNES